MKKIEIYDTTLRDGTQGEGVNLSLQDKLDITVALDELGVDYIEKIYFESGYKKVMDAAKLSKQEMFWFEIPKRGLA